MKDPMPWYVAGPLIGLMVPLLLLIGNKHFGISANLRHICAACLPAKIPFFQYEWKKETWNLLFVIGVFLGGVLASTLLADPNPVSVHPDLVEELNGYGLTQEGDFMPAQLFSWSALSYWRGWVVIVLGGFLVGFGTRYAGGCTSGHAIMGLSTLQWPSLVATVSFMLGGFLMANFGLPILLGQ